MEHIWIPIAITSALCITVRGAAMKKLHAHLPTLVASYVRFLFGLPILIAFAGAVSWVTGEGLPNVSPRFAFFVACSSFAQFAGTALFLQLLTMRNFAVGNMLLKADLIFTALIGAALFSEAISAVGWTAIVVVLAGVLLVSGARQPTGSRLTGRSALGLLRERSTLLGLGVALLFALSYLTLRESTLALAPGSAAHRAAWASLIQATFQVVVMGIWLLLRDRPGLVAIYGHMPLSLFIGTLSGLGSITWFLASAMQNASYVAAVGQVQVVFSILISWLYFRERITAGEIAGIGVILAGVLLFRIGY